MVYPFEVYENVNYSDKDLSNNVINICRFISNFSEVDNGTYFINNIHV